MSDAAPTSPEKPDFDPGIILPIETARALLQHWWREPLAGLLALGIGVYDSWTFGRDAGLSSSLDEILVVGGVVLIAGSKHLFGSVPIPGIGGGNGSNGKNQ